MTDESDTGAPHVRWGYQASDEPAVVAAPASPPLTGEETGRNNRGHRAAVTAAGEVIGSGASAGGKGGPEDYDTDPQAGGGRFELRHEGKPNDGADASQHGST